MQLTAPPCCAVPPPHTMTAARSIPIAVFLDCYGKLSCTTETTSRNQRFGMTMTGATITGQQLRNWPRIMTPAVLPEAAAICAGLGGGMFLMFTTSISPVAVSSNTTKLDPLLPLRTTTGTVIPSATQTQMEVPPTPIQHRLQMQMDSLRLLNTITTSGRNEDDCTEQRFGSNGRSGAIPGTPDDLRYGRTT